MDRSLLEAFGRRVRIGMVGGGADSVIGRTHLIAMRADGLCELTAGAMSINRHPRSGIADCKRNRCPHLDARLRGRTRGSGTAPVRSSNASLTV
jgi:hypothetical protein